jgi:hypothetical protein
LAEEKEIKDGPQARTFKPNLQFAVGGVAYICGKITCLQHFVFDETCIGGEVRKEMRKYQQIYICLLAALLPAPRI